MLRGGELLRLDRAGRLIETVRDVSEVVSCQHHYALRQGDQWVLTTPISRRVLTGIPQQAEVRLSATSTVAYITNGGITLVTGSQPKVVLPEG